MAVVVFGSINMDLVVQASRLPAPGETVGGHGFFTAPGGKGANQAVACARLGAPTRMVGKVGDDVFAATLRDGLQREGIDISAVTAHAGPSGVALIQVDDHAENTIVVVPGANGAVGATDLALLDQALDGASVALLQLEVPLEAVIAAAERARARGVTVVLDPAPARELPAELYRLSDIITPNESEAAALLGFPVTEESITQATTEFHRRGVAQVIIKLGGRGAVWSNGSTAQQIAPFAVQAMDTVAAGDAFNGGLAAALDQGLPPAEAVQWAMAAGACAVTKAGAQPSLPTRAELDAMLLKERSQQP